LIKEQKKAMKEVISMGTNTHSQQGQITGDVLPFARR